MIGKISVSQFLHGRQQVQDKGAPCKEGKRWQPGILSDPQILFIQETGHVSFQAGRESSCLSLLLKRDEISPPPGLGR